MVLIQEQAIKQASFSLFYINGLKEIPVYSRHFDRFALSTNKKMVRLMSTNQLMRIIVNGSSRYPPKLWESCAA